MIAQKIEKNYKDGSRTERSIEVISLVKDPGDPWKGVWSELCSPLAKLTWGALGRKLFVSDLNCTDGKGSY